MFDTKYILSLYFNCMPLKIHSSPGRSRWKVRVPARLAAKLDGAVEKTGGNRSRFVRLAIHEKLARLGIHLK